MSKPLIVDERLILGICGEDFAGEVDFVVKLLKDRGYSVVG